MASPTGCLEENWLLSPPDEVICGACSFHDAYYIICVSTEPNDHVSLLVGVVIRCIEASGRKAPGDRERLLLHNDIRERYPILLEGLTKTHELSQYTVGTRHVHVGDELVRRVNSLSYAASCSDNPLIIEPPAVDTDSRYYGGVYGGIDQSNSSKSSFVGLQDEDDMDGYTSMTSITDISFTEMIQDSKPPSENSTGSPMKPKLFRCENCVREYSKKSELIRHWTQSVKGCLIRSQPGCCELCGELHCRLDGNTVMVEWLPQGWRRRTPKRQDHSETEEGEAAITHFLGSTRSKESDGWTTKHFKFELRTGNIVGCRG